MNRLVDRRVIRVVGSQKLGNYLAIVYRFLLYCESSTLAMEEKNVTDS
jgi:hypothetical protein